MDFSHGSLFCGKCMDYVYDYDFDCIREDEKFRLRSMLSQVKEGWFLSGNLEKKQAFCKGLRACLYGLQRLPK